MIDINGSYFAGLCQNFRLGLYTSAAKGPGEFSRYSDLLRAGRSGDRIPVEARFSATVQTGPGAHPASCTMGTGSFPGVNRPGRRADHPPPPTRRGHERVELYLYSPSGPQWPVIGRTLLHFTLYICSEQTLWLRNSGALATTVANKFLNNLLVFQETWKFITEFKTWALEPIFGLIYWAHVYKHTHTHHFILRTILILLPRSPKWSLLFRLFNQSRTIAINSPILMSRTSMDRRLYLQLWRHVQSIWPDGVRLYSYILSAQTYELLSLTGLLLRGDDWQAEWYAV